MMAEKQEHGKEDQPKPSKSQPTGPDSAEPELSELLASLAPSSGASDEPGGGGLHASSDEEPRHSLAGDSDAPGAEAKEAGQITPGSDEQDPIPAEDPLDDLVSAIDAEVGAQAFEDVTTADEAVQARQRDFKDDHIVFSLLGTSYAVPIGQVTDLEKLPALTTVPHVPDFVLGVANLRGDIISVLDLRTFLGFEQSERLDQGRVLIVKVGQDQTTSGLMVDEVAGYPLDSRRGYRRSRRTARRQGERPLTGGLSRRREEPAGQRDGSGEIVSIGGNATTGGGVSLVSAWFLL